MITSIAAPPGRNEACLCGSGRKYKHCCLAKDEAAAAVVRAEAAAALALLPADVPAELPATSARKTQTHEPWRAGSTSRGFVPASRTPRKMGGG